MVAPLATCGSFAIYQVTRSAWAIYEGDAFLCNARATDAARYGVAFNRAGATAYVATLARVKAETDAERVATRATRLERDLTDAPDFDIYGASCVARSAINLGACSYCEGAGAVDSDQVAPIIETREWLASQPKSYLERIRAAGIDVALAEIDRLQNVIADERRAVDAENDARRSAASYEDWQRRGSPTF